MIRGAIFDLDGTLLDSMAEWEDVGERLLRSKGISVPENFQDTIRDMSIAQALDYISRKTGLAITKKQFFADVDGLMRESYLGRVQLKPYAREFLELLAARNVRMCVATATHTPLAKEALARHGILDYFSFVLSCEDAGAGKEKPDIFEQALAALGTSREDTVVFEDALHAAETAARAGFRVVALRDRQSAGNERPLRAVAERYCMTFEDCEVDLL